MGCGSSSSRAASPTQKKSKEPHDEALETNHTDTQRILKESIQTNLCNTTKENKYNNNDNEKQKTNPKINQEQELVMPSKVQENDTNTNLSKKSCECKRHTLLINTLLTQTKLILNLNIYLALQIVNLSRECENVPELLWEIVRKFIFYLTQ
jgi:hypothetical protein